MGTTGGRARQNHAGSVCRGELSAGIDHLCLSTSEISAMLCRGQAAGLEAVTPATGVRQGGEVTGAEAATM